MFNRIKLNSYLKRSLFFTLLISFPVLAQKGKNEVKPIPKPQSFITHHQGVFNGKTIKYLATAKETY